MIVQRDSPYTNTRDVGFSLKGPINWAGRMLQIEATANMVQEGSVSMGTVLHLSS